MRKTLLSISLAFLSVFAWADEGMWLMTFIERLKFSDWEKEGLKLTPEEIYSINNASLKDAIVSFNGYCTGEIISNQGLLLTNHHCGYGIISQLSSVEHDYLKNGFWANNNSEELKPESLYVRFLVRMDDVTNRMMKVLSPNMTEDERKEAISAESERIEAENNENGKYVVTVKSFFGGNEFYYFVYQDYTDVRFVGAPPSSIGKYGGDTDNWEWPRHTGDFSLFRVYGDKDGNPAKYSTENVPLTPKHSLPIKMTGVKPGDFAMTIGYPGSTARYMPSYGIDQAINVEYPAWIDAANTVMVAMKKHMDTSDEVRINYASSYSGTANYWKNRIGMIEALNKLKTIDKKQEYERDFHKWANQNTERKIKYGNVLNSLKEYYAKTNDYTKNKTYLVRGFLRGSKFSTLPFSVKRFYDSYVQQEEMNKEAMLKGFGDKIKEEYDKMSIEAEQDILVALLSSYVKNVDLSYQTSEIKRINQLYRGDFSKFIDEIQKSSLFVSYDKLMKAIQSGDKDIFENDVLYKFSNDLINSYRDKSDEIQKLEDSYRKNYRLFVQGLRATYPNKIFYPDANFTMRLSTGKVIGLPENTKRLSDDKENYFTTLEGTVKKYVKGDEEFDMPEKLLELYKAKDYGKYVAADGRLHVNFLSNNDITGGNSGSPVISGKGELIGLAFDGNWEAMSGDIEFESNLQRTINVDIRYVLFVIDKFAGATHLVDEMELVWD